MFAAVKDRVRKIGENIVSQDSEKILFPEPNEEYDAKLGPLWEKSEYVENCRGCFAKFQPIIKRKHHCRHCGGVFCEDCSTVGPNQHDQAGMRQCAGCRRGETPGDTISKAVKTRLLEGGKAGDVFDQLKSKIIAKVEEALQAPATPPAIPINVEFGERINKSAAPIHGYFEIINKSISTFAIKLIHGDNPLFEIPRPSYKPVLPGRVVHASFDPSFENVYLIVLYNNPSEIPTDKPIVFDTSLPGILLENITSCARIENFQSVKVFDIQCQRKNILLKVKDGCIVEPRNGNSIGRIGLLSRLQNKRFTPNGLDYATNIDGLNLVLEF